MATVSDTGWIVLGTVRAGVPIRVGLVWRGDPGVTFVTARTDVFDSMVTRTDHARELRRTPDQYYETIEWMTLTAYGPDEFLEILLGWARFV